MNISWLPKGLLSLIACQLRNRAPGLSLFGPTPLQLFYSRPVEESNPIPLTLGLICLTTGARDPINIICDQASCSQVPPPNHCAPSSYLLLHGCCHGVVCAGGGRQLLLVLLLGARLHQVRRLQTCGFEVLLQVCVVLNLQQTWELWYRGLFH
jgi:hypothetical protein